MSTLAERSGARAATCAEPPAAAPYGAVLALASTVAVAGAALVSAVLVLAIRGRPAGYAFLAGLVNQQNQTAKTAAYVLAFLLVLPLALLGAPRLADRIVARAGAASLSRLAAALAGMLALAVIAVRVLPLGGGLAVAVGALLVWALLAGGLVGLVLARPRPGWPAPPASWTWALSGALVLGALLCLTRVHSLPLAGILAGVLVAGAVSGLAYLRPALGLGRLALLVDLVVAAGIVLAVPNLVVFHASPVPPNPLVMPGIVVSQHDFFLGPVNQLLSHGTLLVDAPGSQYGVGDLYLLAGWFHLVPIGYGSFALLDGLLTALFYLGGYVLLRLAGVARWPAVAALALAVCAFAYHLQYPVGVLPEMGPLRFGMPLAVILPGLAAWRWPACRRLARALVYATLAVAAVWSVETFVYTLATFAALTALEAWLIPAGLRRRWLIRQAGLLAAAIVLAHVVFALATLAGSGSLPHWGQYFAYVHSFLLGGKAGEVTYGFDRFSPALALGALLLALAAAVLLLTRRAAAAARAEPVRFLALGASTAYAIVVFSYTDNRSSTYLLPYLAVPALLAVAIALDWLLRDPAIAPAVRRGSAAAAGAVAALMIAAAWPTIGGSFSQTALAKARPGGGARAAVHRLLHPPAIDPRAPALQRLLAAYVPGRRPVVLLADAPDLAIEALMRSGKADGLSIGDTGMDSYVPADWTPRIGRELASLRPGTRLLTDGPTLAVARAVAARPGLDPLAHPLALGGNQMEWILQRLERRYRIVPIARGPYGLVVAGLTSR